MTHTNTSSPLLFLSYLLFLLSSIERKEREQERAEEKERKRLEKAQSKQREKEELERREREAAEKAEAERQRLEKFTQDMKKVEQKLAASKSGTKSRSRNSSFDESDSTLPTTINGNSKPPGVDAIVLKEKQSNGAKGNGADSKVASNDGNATLPPAPAGAVKSSKENDMLAGIGTKRSKGPSGMLSSILGSGVGTKNDSDTGTSNVGVKTAGSKGATKPKGLDDIKVITGYMDCAQNKVGVIIGSKGSIINEIMKRSGCKIIINQDFPDGHPRKIVITGTEKQIAASKPLIRAVIVHGPNVLNIPEIIAQFVAAQEKEQTEAELSAPTTTGNSGRQIGVPSAKVQALMNAYDHRYARHYYYYDYYRVPCPEYDDGDEYTNLSPLYLSASCSFYSYTPYLNYYPKIIIIITAILTRHVSSAQRNSMAINVCMLLVVVTIKEHVVYVS